jgi:hypothetical protein
MRCSRIQRPAHQKRVSAAWKNWVVLLPLRNKSKAMRQQIRKIEKKC